MNFRKNNSLKNLKAKSLKTQELTSIKGGSWASTDGIGGTSKPKRPTMNSTYVGMYFGG